MADQDIHREIIDYCGIHGRVVDYGCGHGSWLPTLSEKCQSVVAIDRLDWMAQPAKELGLPNVQVVVTDTMDFIETGSVDAILLVTALQIFSSGAEWHIFFASAKRVLKPGGVIFFNVPTPRHVRDKFFQLEGIRHIKKHGLWWGLDRQLGWLLLWLRGTRRKSIEATPRYYAVEPGVIETFLVSAGVEVVKRTPEMLAKTKIGEYSGLPIGNKNRPHYSWWLVRKPA